jgi:hypothetical protein
VDINDNALSAFCGLLRFAICGTALALWLIGGEKTSLNKLEGICVH